MSLKLNLAIMFIIVLLFSGCAPTYSIEPVRGENNSTVNIDSLTMHHLRDALLINHNYPNDATGNHNTYDFNINNQCSKRFEFLKLEAKPNRYFIKSLDDILRKKYTKCNVVKISNLYFYSSCSGENKEFRGMHSNFFLRRISTMRFRFLIGMSTPSSSGYSSMSYLYLNQGCYNIILNHFKEKAIKDKVEIKKYKFEN